MLVIGLILVILALVTIGYMWFGTAGLDPVEVDLGAFTMTLSPLWIFLLGAVSVLVLAIGAVLLVAGLRRRQRQRRELRELRRKAEALEQDRRRTEGAREVRDDGDLRDRHDRRDPVVTERRTGPVADEHPGDRVVRDDSHREDHGDRQQEDTIQLPGDRRRTSPDEPA